MSLLAYDTETTGVPLYKEPNDPATWVRSADPRQPHIVQLAASLVDPSTRIVLESINVIVRPDGWTIPDETIELHGITNERALAEGIDEKEAVTRFLDLWLRAERRMAFNEDFDARIMRIAMTRHGWPEDQIEAWKAGPAECAMKTATAIVKAPAKNGKKGYKWPSLQEACAHFGIVQAAAHDAADDVASALAVFWAIQDFNAASAAKPEGEIYVR
jgi:DNA polymerase-3 subunit epsilon